MLLRPFVGHLVSLMRATLTTTKSLLGTRTMNLCNTEDGFFIFCTYSVVMVIFLGRVCHSRGFLFSFFVTLHFILPRSCFIYICSSVQFTRLFLFPISSILTRETPLPRFYSPLSVFWCLQCHLCHIRVLLWSDSQDICLHRCFQSDLRVWEKKLCHCCCFNTYYHY